MGSLPISGDSVKTSDNKEFIIIKKIVDEGTITYLVQENNEFRYHLETMPYDDDNIDAKRRKKGSSQCSRDTSPVPSISSVISVSHWRTEQKKKYNLHFHSERSEKSSVQTEFLSFFEKDVPDEVPIHLKNLTAMNWYDDISNNTDAIQKKLIHQSIEFQLFQSEATAEEFVKTVFELFNVRPASKTKLRFGVADLVLSRMVQGLRFMFCAIEIKGPAPYDILYRDRCRTQLVAYMISMAIDNDEKLQVINGKRFGCQRIFGVLHIGLTPIFYRTDIDDCYINTIIENSLNIPELVIKEFVPIEPYNDREFLNYRSRPILIKSFDTLLTE